jgi:ABC-type sugar transport system ATPase subunit
MPAPPFCQSGIDVTEDHNHLLALKGIEKRFGAVHALKGADFHLASGEVHALFGANGAGKSTLARVMTGHITPSGGEMFLKRIPTQFDRPRAALEAGIGIVTQETALAGDLCVWENIMLPSYGEASRFRRRSLREKAAAALAAIGFDQDIHPDNLCSDLSSAQRQMVEIARAVALDSKIIIFDEPTAALSPSETARLFSVMDRLRTEGHGMVFVSHRLEEIFTITDRVTVLRDGRSVANDIETSKIDQTSLIQLMVGREVAPLKALGTIPEKGELVLRAEKISDGSAVRSVSFDLHAGEILGLGGLVGSGRSEVTEVIFGLRRLKSGRMTLRGAPHNPAAPIDTLKSGVAFLPEDRRRQSIIPDYSVRENILLSALAQSRSTRLGYKSHDACIMALAEKIELPVARLDDTSLLNFSGGMQQKALLIRALLMSPRVLVLDEPTKGVDIGSRSTIYTLLRTLAAEGMAILLISSDFEELLALSHRIVPISDGQSIGCVPANLIDEEQLVLISAPRSSLQRQQTVLSQCALELNANTAWLISSGGRVICLATSEGASLVAGTVSTIEDSPFREALTGPPTRLERERDGRTTMIVPVESPRGHDMGCIALQWENAPPPAWQTIVSKIESLLADKLEDQIRVKKNKE